MYILTARCGEMPIVGEFKCETGELRMGQKVMLSTERGTEIGTVLKRPVAVGDEVPQLPFGRFLRVCTTEDLEKAGGQNTESVSREFLRCRELIKQHELDMTLVHVEHLFGGEKIIFYFIADGRVDFRQLVKDLAHEHHTRIEMKQIGVRDEAKLKGDIEHCGQELCCRRYMSSFEPVTMKMAKNQKATLDPAKISGHCGRLMCCLRYENHVYDELMLNLPKRGSRIITKQGTGKVINSDILAQKVTIETDARLRVTVEVDEIEGRDESTPEQREAARNSRKPSRRSGPASNGSGDRNRPRARSAEPTKAADEKKEQTANDKTEKKRDGDSKPTEGGSRRGGRSRRRKRNPKPQN